MGIQLEGVFLKRGILILRFEFLYKRLIRFMYALHDDDVDMDSNAKQMSQVL